MAIFAPTLLQHCGMIALDRMRISARACTPALRAYNDLQRPSNGAAAAGAPDVVPPVHLCRPGARRRGAAAAKCDTLE